MFIIIIIIIVLYANLIEKNTVTHVIFIMNVKHLC